MITEGFNFGVYDLFVSCIIGCILCIWFLLCMSAGLRINKNLDEIILNIVYGERKENKQ